MISSDQEELKDVRAVLGDVVEEMGYQPILFEDLGASEKSPEEVSLAAVKKCDFYVAILDAAFSDPTRKEYKLASQLGKRIRIYVRNRPAEARDPKLLAFLEEIREERKYDKFEDASDLAEKVRANLSSSVADELLSWPGRIQAKLSQVGNEVSRILGGARLLGSATAGKLSLEVKGVLKLATRLLILLDGGLDAGVREGLELSLWKADDNGQQPLAKLRVFQVDEDPGLVLCEVVEFGESADYWNGLRDSLPEEVVEPLGFESHLMLEDVEKFENPELHIQLLLDKTRRELGI